MTFSNIVLGIFISSRVSVLYGATHTNLGKTSENIYVGDNVPDFEPENLEAWKESSSEIESAFDVVTKVFIPRDWIDEVVKETRHYARSKGAPDDHISVLTHENI